MSRLYVYDEARQWLSEWQSLAAAGSQWAARNIQRAAKEQRANLEAVKNRGYCSDISIPQYEQCVTMIEAAALSLAKEEEE